jgi:hypothetical protein
VACRHRFSARAGGAGALIPAPIGRPAARTSLPGRRCGRGRCQGCGVPLDDRVSHIGRPGVWTRHHAAAPADRGDNLATGRITRNGDTTLDRNQTTLTCQGC